MAKKEFKVNFSEMGPDFTLTWTAVKLSIRKMHFKEIPEEIRIENLTDKELEITIEQHGLLKHPSKVSLGPKEVRHVVLKIPCNKVMDMHKSVLVLKSANQKINIPIQIEHYKDKK